MDNESVDICFHDSSALVGLDILTAEVSRSHTHTHTHTHRVGLLRTGDGPVAQISTWQHTTLTKDRYYASDGIRTRHPSKQAAAYPRLRLRGLRTRWQTNGKNKSVNCSKTASWLSSQEVVGGSVRVVGSTTESRNGYLIRSSWATSARFVRLNCQLSSQFPHAYIKKHLKKQCSIKP